MAKKMADTHCHLETDQYFMHDGKYEFDPSRLLDAHNWCLVRTKTLLDQGCCVVVSNTFTQEWEMRKYIDLGYPTRVLTAKGNYGNVHGVPPEAIARMKARWEE